MDIPKSHRDLLEEPANVIFTTVMPDRQPQTTPVWCNLDGNDVLIDTMSSFRKTKNMRLNSMVTLLAYRLEQPLCNIEVRDRRRVPSKNNFSSNEGRSPGLNSLSHIKLEKAPIYLRSSNNLTMSVPEWRRWAFPLLELV